MRSRRVTALVALLLAAVLGLSCANRARDHGGGDGASGDDSAGDDATDDDAGDDAAGDDDSGSEPPTYPANHVPTWFCYTCHEEDFNGAKGEPHGHAYVAPDQCVTCHPKGDWINPPNGPVDPFPIMDCLKCHPGHHGKETWQDYMECVVCHQPATR